MNEENQTWRDKLTEEDKFWLILFLGMAAGVEAERNRTRHGREHSFFDKTIELANKLGCTYDAPKK